MLSLKRRYTKIHKHMKKKNSHKHKNGYKQIKSLNRRLLATHKIKQTTSFQYRHDHEHEHDLKTNRESGNRVESKNCDINLSNVAHRIILSSCTFYRTRLCNAMMIGHLCPPFYLTHVANLTIICLLASPGDFSICSQF